MRFTVEFYGRESGAIGTTYRISEGVDVEGPPVREGMNSGEVYDHPAVKAMYRKYEHISLIRLSGGGVAYTSPHPIIARRVISSADDARKAAVEWQAPWQLFSGV